MARKTTLRIWSYFSPADRAMLRQPAVDVDMANITTPPTQQLIDDMLITMRQAEGIGLAAPQIGRSIRLTVIDRSVDPLLTDDLVLINPRVLQPSLVCELGEEGCLSIPKVFGEVERSKRLRLHAFDRRGLPYQLEAQDLLARVIQHEINHLDGILFIDHAVKITKGKELLP